MPKPVPSKPSPRPVSPQTPKDPMHSMRETCVIVGCATQTGYNSFWTQTGILKGLPVHRFGRAIRFAQSDIEQFIASKRQVPGNGA